MAGSPQATPHSDVGGVHQNEVRNTDLSEDAETLDKAAEKTVARPEYVEEQKKRYDRSG